MTANKTLMAHARKELTGKWGHVVLATLLYWGVSMAAQIIPVLGKVLPVLIAGPLALGFAYFFLHIARGHKPEIQTILSGFDRFGTALATYLLAILFIMLWSLLLIIPGIIAAIAYSQAFFLLVDNPKMTPMEAIDASKKMMHGHKWKIFCLGLRFVGWMILSVLTLGIGFLWLIPYMATSYAKFYEDIKGKMKAVEAK